MGYFATPNEYDIGGYESQLTCMLNETNKQQKNKTKKQNKKIKQTNNKKNNKKNKQKNKQKTKQKYTKLKHYFSMGS
jgi:hypothetical protein